MRPNKVLPLQARVDVGAIAMKGLLRIPKSSSITETSPSDCLFSYQDMRWGSLTSLTKWSWCILQPQATGPLVGAVLRLCRDAFGVFYNQPPFEWSSLGEVKLSADNIYNCIYKTEGRTIDTLFFLSSFLFSFSFLSFRKTIY